MAESTLAKFVDPEVLNKIADRAFEPRNLVQGALAGAHASPLSGFAVEFAGHREYVPGDDPRHIDWRVYYTRGKYFVKQYEMETNLVAHLVLDASASMRYGVGDQQKLQYAAKTAATLAYCVVRQRDKVSFSLVDDAVRVALPPSNSPAQLARITDELDRLECTAGTSLPRLLPELVERFQRREIVLLISDFLLPPAELEPSLQRLRYYQHEVVLMQVLHHDEIEFRLPGNVNFVGLETGGSVSARPADLRKAYLDAFAAHAAELEQLAQRNQCEFLRLNTSRDLAETLADYLSQRNLAGGGR